MKCSLIAGKSLRTELTKVRKDIRNDIGEVSADGTSFSLSDKLLELATKDVSNPEAVIKTVHERNRMLSDPLHQSMRKEMGEELLFTKNGQEEIYYLLGSSTERDISVSGETLVHLTVAPADDITASRVVTFELGQNTDTEGLFHKENMAELIGKGLLRHASLSAGAVEVKYTGDQATDATLSKMAAANKLLGSSAKVSSESLVGYEKIDNYKHGDVSSMKEIMTKLHVLGKTKASNTLMKYYSDLFDMMHPRFFNELELYIKKSGVGVNGFVDMEKHVLAVKIGDKTDETYMSAAEAYTHEVIHSMTAWALEQKITSVSDIRSELENLMNIAKKNTTWKDFLKVDEAIANDTQKEEAERAHNYVFASENGLHEFVAWGMTNPQFMKKLQNTALKSEKEIASRNVFQKLASLFGRLVNKVLGRVVFKSGNETLYSELMGLTFRLAEINNTYAAEVKEMNPLGKMMEALGSADVELGRRLTKFKDSLKNDSAQVNVPPEGASLFENAKFLLDFGVKLFTSETHRKYFGRFVSAWGLKPDSSIREIFSSFMEKNDVQRGAEKLLLLANNIDAIRNSTAGASAIELREDFNPSKEDDIALTEVLLETNVAGLRYDQKGAKTYTDAELRKLLTDHKYRYERMGRVKHRIRELIGEDTERANWTISQSIFLGYFMATGRGNIALNTNSGNIGRGYGLNTRYESSLELEGAIRELSSIEALNHTNNDYRKAVARMLKDNTAGVNKVTAAYQAYKANSSNMLFKERRYHMMDGHLKELFDQTIDVKIAPMSQKQDLIDAGFEFKYELAAKEGDSYSNTMGLFTTASWGRAERQRGAISLGNTHAKGTTMSELKRIDDNITADVTFQRDMIKMSRRTQQLNELMMRRELSITDIDLGMMPVYDKVGNIVDYRYMMDKEQKKELLGQDKRATYVVPKSAASVVNQRMTEDLNLQVLDFLKKDMMENWKEGEIGEDGTTEYTVLSPNASDEKHRQMYALLPEVIREYAASRTDKSIAIRTEILPIMMGYKHARLSDMVGINQLPVAIRKLLNLVEGMWTELIKLSKSSVLIKMPLVIGANIVSNLAYLISTGSVDIPQLYRDHKESIKEVNDYLNRDGEIRRLEQRIDMAQADLGKVRNRTVLEEKVKDMRTRLAMLQQQQVRNPAHELFEGGLYQAYIMNTFDLPQEDSNRISMFVNKGLDKLPPVLKKAAQWSYLAQGTEWHTVMQETLQRSDMIARLVDVKRKERIEHKQVTGQAKLPLWWLKHKNITDYDTKRLAGEEKKEFLEMSKKVRLEAVLDSFVNYTLPNGKGEEYLNRIGVLMFTKYLKRSQKIIFDSLMTHPMKTALLLLLSHNVVDISTVQDSSFFLRGISGEGLFDITRLTSIYGPMYHMDNVFNPALFKDSSIVGKIF